MKNKKIFILTLSSLCILASCGKTNNAVATFDPNIIHDLPFVVDKSKLYGMCDLSYEEDYWRNSNPETKIDYHYSHQLMKNLGVTSVRFWTHFSYFMSGPTTFIDNKANFQSLRSAFFDLVSKNPNASIIGMNHTNYGGDFSSPTTFTTCKPSRDLSENSNYRKWLKNYEESWYTLVRCFPEIEYWEIDNEINNNDFMKPSSGSFTTKQKAEISADMLYFGSRGIHRANPNAKTISGGIIMFNQTDTINFVNYLYNEIAQNTWGTTSTKDFFQIFGMHPYISSSEECFSKTLFTSRMNSIYNVVRDREGKDKIVYCTEVGFNDYYINPSTKSRIGQTNNAGFIKDMYEAAADLPYVESLCYYKMYDDENKADNRYGLFTDPINKRTYEKDVDGGQSDTFIAPLLASPKPGAEEFKKLAGGTGDLYVYADALRY